MKNYENSGIRTRTYWFRNVCLNLTAEMNYSIIKKRANINGIKRKTSLLKESFLLHIWKFVGKNYKKNSFLSSRVQKFWAQTENSGQLKVNLKNFSFQKMQKIYRIRIPQLSFLRFYWVTLDQSFIVDIEVIEGHDFLLKFLEYIFRTI